MLQIHSSVKFEDIESVMRIVAQRHRSSLLAVSHVGQVAEGEAAPRDAMVFTLCHSKLSSALLEADMRFASFLPCRVAAWRVENGVMLEALAPSDYCKLLGRTQLDRFTIPLEHALRAIMEEAAHPLTMTAGSPAPDHGHTEGATEDQVNMRLAVPQRIDSHGSKIEDKAGTGSPDTLGG